MQDVARFSGGRYWTLQDDKNRVPMKLDLDFYLFSSTGLEVTMRWAVRRLKINTDSFLLKTGGTAERGVTDPHIK